MGRTAHSHQRRKIVMSSTIPNTLRYSSRRTSPLRHFCSSDDTYGVTASLCKPPHLHSKTYQGSCRTWNNTFHYLELFIDGQYTITRLDCHASSSSPHEKRLRFGRRRDDNQNRFSSSYHAIHYLTYCAPRSREWSLWGKMVYESSESLFAAIKS
eukprot:scaffold1918_cov154-Amphora_coffeaeformis.AAC.8